MSKTYNSKHDFNKWFSDIEYPNGFARHGYELEPGETFSTDLSGTTTMDHPYEKCVRHPNKRKKTHSLGREFTNTGIMGTRYWRNRFGEEDSKSSRCRLTKREQNQKRRHKLKNETQEIINREMEDE